MKKIITTICLAFLATATYAQNEKAWIKHRIEQLSADNMHGRGFINNGGDNAALYIANQFKASGVLPLNGSSYYQDYNFDINTFPEDVLLTVNGKMLRPGKDYIVHAASSPWHGWQKELKTLKLGKVTDSTDWELVKQSMKPGGAYYLQDADVPIGSLRLGIRKLAQELPEGLFIVPKHGKLIWTTSQSVSPATIFYVEDTVLPKQPEEVLATVDAQYVNDFSSKNVIGYVKGTEVPDSFIVFTAHYDHLGRMGQETVFSGAHDNASGTAMVLYLAHYFAQHPQRYSVAFMLFSGEEVGLLGSKYYTEHPIAPLANIRFLINMDMVGYANDGITVVNGIAHEPEFNLLTEINQEHQYLKQIKKRERTSNSDHYFFSKNGVPAVFIYGMGGKPFYHDVFDVASEITLDNIDDLSHLFIDFTKSLTNTK